MRRERWEAGSGAVFDLRATPGGRRAGRRPTPRAWRSCPGLVRYDEAVRGPIRHALRVTVRATNGYVWPASHRAGCIAARCRWARACG